MLNEADTPTSRTSSTSTACRSCRPTTKRPGATKIVRAISGFMPPARKGRSRRAWPRWPGERLIQFCRGFSLLALARRLELPDSLMLIEAHCLNSIRKSFTFVTLDVICIWPYRGVSRRSRTRASSARVLESANLHHERRFAGIGRERP